MSKLRPSKPGIKLAPVGKDYKSDVWKDINLGTAQVTTPAANFPGQDEFKDSTGTDMGITALAYAVGEGVSGMFELQHDYKEGSDIYFHVHWEGIAAPSGTDNVQWQLSYSVVRNDAVISAVTTIQSGDTPFDTQYEAKVSSFAAITGTGFQIGDQFIFKFERVASTGDAYAGEALVLTLGLHYQVDTLGSESITSK